MMRLLGPWSFCLLLLVVARAETLAGDPAEPLLAPEDLESCQIDYGGSSVVRLSWSNPENYELLEVLVDGDPLTDVVDGAATATVVEPLSPGLHAFGLRGLLGERMSAIAEVSFEVLLETPLQDPVQNLSCGFFPGFGGRLRITWELGAQSWASGEVRIDGRAEPVLIDEAATEVEVAGVGPVPPEVVVAFKDGAGYFSEPYLPDCPPGAPLLRRGDCDGTGVVNITDAILTVNHLFLGGRRWHCDDACDADDSGDIDMSDPLLVLNHLFAGGMEPPAPGPRECGLDETPDFLGGVCTCE